MQPHQSKRKSNKKSRIAGILLGVILGLVCRYLPEKYQGVCNTVAEITAISCGG